MEYFQAINRAGTTIVLITHEEEIANYTKRIIRVVDGKIVSDKKR
jgi:putative ABC transport system ATP-binding protein